MEIDIFLTILNTVAVMSVIFMLVMINSAFKWLDELSKALNLAMYGDEAGKKEQNG